MDMHLDSTLAFDKTALKVPANSNPKRNIDAKETVH